MVDFVTRAKALVSKMTLDEKLNSLIYNAIAIPRLGIAEYNWWNEGSHGVGRSGKATVFPSPMGMASSFDKELVFKIGDIISTEARAKYNEYKKKGYTAIYEGLTLWSPNINLFRDPRWGRGQETFGEDPVLTALLGTEYVKGLQGEGKYHKVDATLKHYFAHSGPEKGRHGFNVELDEKTLREYYLYAFEYIIKKAEPAAIMTAYNAVNGEPMSASKTYLKELLREELGFKGYVVSDCGAICDINEYHHLRHNKAESAAWALNTGCDLNCGDSYAALKVAVLAGLVSEEVVTRSAERLFEARIRLGMFDEDCPYDAITFDKVECAEHTEVNLEIAQESIVLLKNENNILPLKNNLKIAIIGPNADDKEVLMGNYNGRASLSYTFWEGIREECAKRNCTATIAKGCNISAVPRYWEEQYYNEAVIDAERADVVILFCGLNSRIEGEEGDAFNSDYGGDKFDLEFPESQRLLYNKLKQTGKPIIFVSVSGSCMSLKSQQMECEAIFQVFYPGAMGGKAFADILFGNCSPSGRLPVTFYKNSEDLPSIEDYSIANRTHLNFKGEICYPFGFGLTYSDITEDWLEENSCCVTNNGPFDTRYSVLKWKGTKLEDFKSIYLKKGEVKEVKF